MKKRILCIALCVVMSILVSCDSSNNKDDTYKATYSAEAIRKQQQEIEAISKYWSTYEIETFELNFKTTIEITYTCKLTYNNSVGNEWRKGVLYNDEFVDSGSNIIPPSDASTIALTFYATELDEYNDYGSYEVIFDIPQEGKSISKTITVNVRENNGRYTGNYATWTFYVTIERIF